MAHPWLHPKKNKKLVHQLKKAREDRRQLKQIQTRLRASETQYRIVAENTYDWEFWCDPEGCFLYCSPSCERITGYKAEDFHADPALRARSIHPDDRPWFEAHVREAESLRIAGEGEWRFLRPDGTWRWIGHVCQPVFDEDGKYLGCRCSDRDITPRRQFEDALRESEQRMQQALNASHSFAFEWDPITDRVKRSTSCVPILNLSDDEVANGNAQGHFQNIHPGDRERFLQMLGMLTPTASNYSTEYRVRRKDGSTIILEEVGQGIFDAAGNLTRLFGVATDITGRRLIEEALSKNEMRLKMAQVAAGAGIWEWDFESGKHEWSEEMFRFLGFNPDKVQPSFDAWKSALHPEDRLQAEQKVEEAIKGHTLLNNEYRIPSSTGEVRWINALGNTVYDEGGKPEKMYGICLDVTARRQAEEMLHRERSLLESVMKSTDVMLVMLDAQFNFLWVNEAYAQTCQMKPAEMVGRNHFALYPHKENEAIFRKVRDTGQGIFFKDKPFRFPDQPERGITYWDWSLLPVKDASGEVASLVFSLRETTKFIRTQEALYKSEATLKRAQQMAGAGIWDWDVQSGSFQWSEELSSLLGLDPEKGASSFDAWLERIFPDDREAAKEKIMTAAREHAALEMEYRLSLPDGKVRWIGMLGNAVYDQADKALHIAGICLDITNRKKTENKLRESEEGLRALVTATSDVVYYMSPDWHEMRRLVGQGFLADAAVPNANWLQDYIFPEDQARVMDVIHEAIRTRGTFELEHRVRRVGGVEGWTFSRAIPILNARGEIINWFGIASDITERKKAEEVLQRSKETFERLVTERTRELIDIQAKLVAAKRLSDIGSLAATVAHELRTPLSVIRIGAYNLKQKSSDPALLKHISHIEKKVSESEQIINNLLFYSRIKFPVFEEVNVRQLLDECSEAAQSGLDGFSIRIVKRYKDIDGRFLRADPLQLKEVFSNMLANAVDALTGRDGQIEIAAGYTENRRMVCIHFKDNGCGISPETLSRIYEPFFTTKARGTGLGLPVCYQIVQNHGGKIDVMSEEGKGTLFTISFPVGEGQDG